MKKLIADLHCHPSLKPNGDDKIKDIWVDIENTPLNELFSFISWRKLLVGGILKNMATYSQSSLDKCYKGRNRLLFCSIYPFERQFLKPNRPFKRSTFIRQLLLWSIFGKSLKRAVDTKIITALTGVSKETISKYLNDVYDNDTVVYLNDYNKEYQYLMQSHNSNSTNAEFVRNPSFKLVKNYEELISSLDETTICGILTIEGMHALGEYKKEHLFNQQSIDDLDSNDRQLLEQSFINNIATVKGKNDPSVIPPYFITFAHHFNNLIAGHAKSFKDGQFIKPGFSDVFDQTNGQDRGLTQFAKDLIVNHLFSRHNGSRILVDTKHMSLNSRDDYFKLVSTFNENNPSDIVPIVVSHTAVNGLKDRATARQTQDKNGIEKNSYVSRWDINLTDEDIQEVFATNGIIGICMHDGRMPGDNFKKLFRQQKTQVDSDESIMRLHSQMFLTNVFHVVKVTLNYIRQLNSQGEAINENNAWNTLSLGSDNDGIVDPFDNYNSADFLLDFKLRIKRSIEQNHKPFFKNFQILSLPDEKPFSQEQLADLMQGLSAELIVDKIFSDNTDTFLSHFFTKDYLTKGSIEELLV